METIEKSIEVNAPIRQVYNQWTQFEEFPNFMEGVQEVRQLTDRKLFWRAKVAGKEKEWNAEITQQIPDREISWRSIDGASNTGTVLFSPIDADRTQVILRMQWEPESAVEKVGEVLGADERRVEGDLKRFRDFIEKRQVATGAYRQEHH
ncbi:MAG: SRPBCC family protein [Verrucomicrobia bacterium]|nr:SRPBCC family protein [Verrucomicrobiota bacterium]